VKFQVSKHIVIFVDILGFKEMIKDSDKKRKKEVIEAIETLLRLDDVIRRSSELVDNHSLRTMIMSDSITCSLPFISTENDPQLAMMLKGICTFQCFLLTRGILSRGGISIGNFYQDEKIMFGEALVDSYLLEEKEANYPRVIISEQDLMIIVNNSGFMKEDIINMFSKDDDGYFFLDYLKFSQEEACNLQYEEIEKWAIKFENSYFEVNESISGKYRWIKEKIKECK